MRFELHFMSNTFRPYMLYVIVAVVFAGLCAGVYGQPQTVYAYNHDPDDGFDSDAEVYIWQQLGLLDANGRPIDPIPEAQIIRDGDNNIIGYRSANGNLEAYDLNSSATADQAWQRVAADNGTLHIIKHGSSYRDDQGVEHNGGGVQLDGAEPYDGFGNGTGVGYVRSDGQDGPYGLTARAGANITINVNACYSSNDPDGATGEQRAVTASAGDVDGVGATEGHDRRVHVVVNWDVAGGTAQNRNDARAALRAEARAEGFPPEPDDGAERRATTNDDVAAWILSLAAARQHATAQQAIDDALQPGIVRLQLAYAKAEEAGDGERLFTAGGVHQCPIMLTDTEGGDVIFSYGDEFVAASMLVEPGDLAARAVFHVNMLGELPAPPPAGDVLGGGVFLFEMLGGGPIISPVTITAGFYAAPPEAVLFWYDPQQGDWVPPVGGVSIDPVNKVAVVTTQQLGIYAVFAPVPSIPAFGPWGVISLTLALFIAGSIALRRQRVWRAGASSGSA